MIKDGGDSMLQLLTVLVQLHVCQPFSWLSVGVITVVPVAKTSGSSDMSTYRGIQLIL